HVPSDALTEPLVKLGENSDRFLGFGPVGLCAVLAVTVHRAAAERLHRDAVGARHEIDTAVLEAVVELALGDQPGDLTPHRHDAFVAEQRAGAKARAVYDHLLRQLAKLAGGVELAALDPAAGLAELPVQQVRVSREVEHQVGLPAHGQAVERGHAGIEGLGAREQVAQARSEIRELGLVRRAWTARRRRDRKSTRLNSSHVKISYAVFCLKK